MKKLLLCFVLLLESLLLYSQKRTFTFTDIVIQKGGETTVPLPTSGTYGHSCDQLGSCIFYDEMGFYGTSSYQKICTLYGAGRGNGIFYTWYDATKYIIYRVKVVDVVRIDILEHINLIVGENYTYSPIITDTEATTTLSWTSSDPSVATINSNGIVTAVGVGKTTITCTATNGIKSNSIVTVKPILAKSLSLDQQNLELSAGDNILLTPTVLPENVTSSFIKWFSGNENIAQVDENGNVTAVAPGYCSIYAIADDGSGKYGKCLVHVLGGETVQGDTNGDGEVTPQDASLILQYIAKKITW